MAEANDSVEVTPGTGASVATQLVNGKEYQVMIETNAQGHLVGDIPTYSAFTSPTGGSTNKHFMHLWNGAGSGKILKIKKVFIQMQYSGTAVTGAPQTWRIAQTSSAGSNATALTIRPHDAGNPAVPSQITASHTHGTFPTQAFTYFDIPIFTEETSHQWGFNAYFNILPTDGDRVTDYVINEGQGLLVQLAQSSPLTFNYSVLAVFSIE